jgi:hypothetical protein
MLNLLLEFKYRAGTMLASLHRSVIAAAGTVGAAAHIANFGA